jgi:predicted CXXCH cytochrome family protein
MKRSIAKTMLLVMIVVVSVMMVAQISRAAVKDTKHNLGTSTGNPGTIKLTAGTDEVCVFCHTPHFAATTTATTAPLWNRTLPATNYTMYTSSTLDMTPATGTTIAGVSLACLSCHDGAVAFDTMLNAPGTGLTKPAGWTGGVALTGAATNIGTDLKNDHPVSIIYDVTKDPKFTAITTAGTKKTIVAGSITLPLFDTKVECASCHDVHGGTASTPFLRASNTGSALCLTCHVK